MRAKLSGIDKDGNHQAIGFASRDEQAEVASVKRTHRGYERYGQILIFPRGPQLLECGDGFNDLHAALPLPLSRRHCSRDTTHRLTESFL